MPAITLSPPDDFQSVVIAKLSDDERISQRLTLENMGIAVSALHRDGLVVLENAVDLEHVDQLNAILTVDALEMAQLPTTHYNDVSEGPPVGNMSQGPPLEPSLMFSDIWANGPAISVISAVFGPKPRVNFVNGNTALSGFKGGHQNVHADLTWNHAQFPFGFVTNYYLTDVSPANASTELWLGSHRDTSFADHKNCRPDDPNFKVTEGFKFGIRNELVEARRAYAPPIQPTVKRGSVVIRDLRLWHAGVSNPSPDPRIMLAFVHTPWYYDCPGEVALPETARGLVEEWASRENNPVVYNAHFAPVHLDHKVVPFTLNFSSHNKGFNSMLPDLPRGFVFGNDEMEN
ncbi:hypothetical protein AOQ84DRAFT_310391 [Glonium stellatum]|uniref:Phytanoyl-CoA dioxygenase family protein n=1 Tax=Glonium stellatum TaxID=574774 RepID=A0A8E2FBE5_9PEZI|nr:hypothetical protein AOQ84DRAFT_310391 [Glonium stellatum]